MRTRIVLAGLVAGVAASFAPLSPASAACISAWEAVTGDCSPCDEIERVTGKPLNCIQ